MVSTRGLGGQGEAEKRDGSKVLLTIGSRA